MTYYSNAIYIFKAHDEMTVWLKIRSKIFVLFK